MGRVLSDLVRGMDARAAAPETVAPTSIATFYDGGCPDCRRDVERYRSLAFRRLGRRADLLWRDIRTCPDALRCFGVDRRAARHGIYVVDRAGRMRSGVDALIALWRELPGYRPLAWLLGLPGIHDIAARLWRHGFARPHRCAPPDAGPA